jgi:hypothetical protein
MKASAMLLAGLLTGFALGGVSQAQPPSGAPTVLAQNDDDDNAPVRNPARGVSPRAAQCALGCQGPTAQCTRRCGQENPDCMDRCATKHTACMKKCGVDIEKLREEADQ